MVSDAVFSILRQTLGKALDGLLQQWLLRRQIRGAIARAEQRFLREHGLSDPELVRLLISQRQLSASPSVQAVLEHMLTHPFTPPRESIAQLSQSFEDVLPGQADRRRVQAAVSAFLLALGDEVLYIPRLQALYGQVFRREQAQSSREIADSSRNIESYTRLVAESSQAIQQHTGLIAGQISSLGDQMKLLSSGAERPLLPAPALSQPRHNLPPRNKQFFGREDIFERVLQLMLPYPRSRHTAVTIDGVGGVGKSTLAIQVAWHYVDHYAGLPADERFEAIIWSSAKRTLLTSGGVMQRRQSLRTLLDLYRDIASVLEVPALLQADAAEQHRMICQALAAQRTLLLIDNLETVDDEALLALLEELPHPTKLIITTRHRIGIAVPLRLEALAPEPARRLILAEARDRDVELSEAQVEALRSLTGGLPLAVVWSIGLISMGKAVETVLRRLKSGKNDVARFCFAESLDHIRSTEAYRVLLTLALFEASVSRELVGRVAGLADEQELRDDALATLVELSLVDHRHGRFQLLPLTQRYLLDELGGQPALERELRQRWAEALVELAQPYGGISWSWRDRRLLAREGAHCVTLLDWAEKQGQLETVVGVLPAVLSYFDLLGEWSTLVATARRGLEYAASTNQPATLILLHDWLNRVLSQQGSHAEAEQHCQSALRLAQTLDSPTWECGVLLNCTQALRRRGQPEQAEQHCAAIASLLPRLAPAEQAYIQAAVLYERGKIARDRQDWETARDCFVKGQALFEYDELTPLFAPELVGGLLANLGVVEQQRGQLDAAADYYRQALEWFEREVGSRADVLGVLLRLALIEEQRGHRQQALAYAEEVVRWASKLQLLHELERAQQLQRRLGQAAPEAYGAQPA